jgi:hypothetical protein
MPELTHEHLTHLMECNPFWGVLFWKNPQTNRVRVGEQVGSLMRGGYRQTSIDGERYLIHRLIWFYVHKEWPNGFLDHINQNKRDNSIQNLRVVTNSENMHNRGATVKSTTGQKGIYIHKPSGRYRVMVKHNYKMHHGGYYHTIEAALTARDWLAAQLEQPSGFSVG